MARSAFGEGVKAKTGKGFSMKRGSLTRTHKPHPHTHLPGLYAFFWLPRRPHSSLTLPLQTPSSGHPSNCQAALHPHFPITHPPARPPFYSSR